MAKGLIDRLVGRPRRQANSVFAAGEPRPAPGRLVQFEPADATRQYHADDLTPSQAATLLKRADSGDIGAALELFEEITDRDGRLMALLRKRRLALTGLPYEIVSAADVAPEAELDRDLADLAARFCRLVLLDVTNFDQGLRHLAHGITEGISVAEMVWDVSFGRRRLAELADVPVNRLRYEYSADNQLRVTTETNSQGLRAEPGKFVVHAPTARSGFPQRGSLLRALTFNHLARRYSLRWWATFCEIFGMPIRSATYGQNATADEKREMLNMLRLLGSESVAIFSDSMKLNLVESSQRGTAPYEQLAKHLNEDASIAVLGQTLTTQMSDSGGSYAAARVHEGVEEALAEDDRVAEGETIREQVLDPIVRWSFPVPNAPVPYFRRVIEEPKDELQEAQRLQALAVMYQTAINMGLPVTRDVVYEALEIDKPAPNTPKEDFIKRPDVQIPPGYSGITGGFVGNLG